MPFYKVILETDESSGAVTAKLPSLNNTADFGPTAEEALSNLKELAQGFLVVLQEHGETAPASDRVEAGSVYLSLSEPVPLHRQQARS